MTTLTPNYLDIDFTTIITRIKEQLATSDTFQDYNYEGANFTIMMELFAYVAELNTQLEGIKIEVARDKARVALLYLEGDDQ